MQHRYMRRFGLILFCLLILTSLRTSAGTYTLTDGTKIAGEPISQNDSGVIFKTDNDVDVPRVPWNNFTQDSLQLLLSKAKTPRERALIESLLDQLPQEKAQRKEIVVKPIDQPVRPTAGVGLTAIFGSPIGLFVLLVLYGANLFAAYEIAIYRRQPIPMVCGLAAIPFLGIFSPIFFIAMPSRVVLIDGQAPVEAPVRFQTTAPPTSAPPQDETPGEPRAVAASNPSYEAVANAPSLPQPIVFQRGDFSFNRRFFETKLAGFFRVVPGENERDMVIEIISGRGNFVGRRITRITPTELYLQVFRDNATADEMIPFVEILEVQLRHKDIV
ncbi:MAG TPA: hypothetical protein VFC44_07555 [Candidatus Saccharimonadales bacterium]|nr:hypothetical protein [Candidatus Saccharimonadales bacterium]